MEVVVVSPTKQFFNGLNYWKSKGSRYCKNAQHKPHYLHRAVWEYHNGKIPVGKVIDHIDWDTDNNQIENLRCVSVSDNLKNLSPVGRESRKKHCDKIRHLAKKWHSSDEGKKWHSEHAKKMWA